MGTYSYLFESIKYTFNGGRLVRRVDPDDAEGTRQTFHEWISHQIMLSSAANALSLCSCDGLPGFDNASRPTGFDLKEIECFSTACDDIDLASLGSIIAGQDAISIPAQIVSSKLFAPIAFASFIV